MSQMPSKIFSRIGRALRLGNTMNFRVVSLLAVLLLGCSKTQMSARPDDALKGGKGSPQVTFQKNIQPLLQEYCFSCHGEGKKKGDLALDIYKDEKSILADRKVWEKVLHNVVMREMPPEKKKQPSQAERDLLAEWIKSEIFQCDCNHPDPGRVTLHRLNRTEYNSTIRDLVGVNFQPADDFPQDDVGYGFDNIGDVLSLPPILMEKYLAAAEKIMNAAIVTDTTARPKTNQFDAIKLEGTAPSGESGEGMRSLQREGDVHVPFEFLHDGDYVLRVRAYGEQAGSEPARMAFLLNDKEVKRFDVTAIQGAPQIYETTLKLTPGKKKFGAAYLNNYVNKTHPDPKMRGDRNLVIDYLEIVAPADTKPRVLPESHRRIFTRAATPETQPTVAREILGNFTRRAYRRPVSSDEVERLMKIVELAKKNGETFEGAIQLALEAVLISPHFLFRGELQPEPNNPQAIHRVNEYALASRLSYFLWSSMPDEALFAEAERGTLRKNLEAQVKRMLKDPKSRALVDNFAEQWLQIRNLSTLTPDKKTFPNYDDDLRDAMVKETELFFENVIREDRSILDFLNADYTFLNDRLAQHYGIKGVKGAQFQRVSLKGPQRGGILTHASVLTITSNPTRTSPVKRGKWILENILGTPPPPPPPDVPELKEGKEAALTGSLRQRMEQHRANPNCASCHERMDPIGFGFENFDGIGAWREQDAGFVIDPAGKLVTGETFQGPADLKTILMKRKKDDFVRCLSEKMLTYALGRGLEYYDKCATDQISKNLAKNRYKFSTLILEVIKSTPFQLRRGEEDRSLPQAATAKSSP